MSSLVCSLVCSSSASTNRPTMSSGVSKKKYTPRYRPTYGFAQAVPVPMPVGGAARVAYRAYRPRAQYRQAHKDKGYVDLATANYAMDTTGSITLVATIAQGTTVNTRVGKRAAYVSIQGRGYAFNGSTATSNQGVMILVYDRRPTGSLPAITDILDTATSNSFNNDANSDRFLILKRKEFFLIGTQSAADGPSASAENADFFMRVNKPIVFKAAGSGAIADISEGAIYLVTVGNTAAGTAAATLNLGFRTRFIDV